MSNEFESVNVKVHPMTDYLTKLITEKGRSLSDEMAPNGTYTHEGEVMLEGHFGLTWGDLVEYIESATDHHKSIRDTLVKIDFHNGDVFHFLNYLAIGMLKAAGY